MNKLDDVTLLDLLPPNLKRDPDAIAASAALADEYKRIYNLASKAVVFANIENLAESWLDLLAVDMHVDYYVETLPIDKKRELVIKSIPLHRKKGTPWAVEELIGLVFGDGRVEEWWEYGGEPYHFRVRSFNPLTTPEDVQRFTIAVNSVKNLRSVLEDVIITRVWQDVYDENATWGDVLGVKTWGEIADKYATWGDLCNTLENWGEVYGERAWGEIYNYIWEG